MTVKELAEKLWWDIKEGKCDGLMMVDPKIWEEKVTAFLTPLVEELENLRSKLGVTCCGYEVKMDERERCYRIAKTVETRVRDQGIVQAYGVAELVAIAIMDENNK